MRDDPPPVIVAVDVCCGVLAEAVSELLGPRPTVTVTVSGEVALAGRRVRNATASPGWAETDDAKL